MASSNDSMSESSRSSAISSKLSGSPNWLRTDDLLGLEASEFVVGQSQFALEDLAVVLAERGRRLCPVAVRAGGHADRPGRIVLLAHEFVLQEFEEVAGLHLRIVDRHERGRHRRGRYPRGHG